jgi:Skp family chaperone for outer membrane proteins
MIMKIVKIILIICALASMRVSAQQIAYVYTDSVLLSYPRYATNVLRLDSMKQQYQKELEKDKIQLQERADKLLKPYNKADNETLDMLKKRMAPTDSVKLSDLLEENTMLQNKTKRYDNLLKSLYAQDIQPILDQATKVIADYAVKNNLTAIYSMEQVRTTLVYIDKKRDVTKPIVELMKKKK